MLAADVARSLFQAKGLAAQVENARATVTMSDVDLSWFIDDTVTKQVATAKGVVQVQRLGGVKREINVTLNPDRLDALGLTAPVINEALRRHNVDAPGGTADIGGRAQTIRVLGAAETVERLRNTTLSTGKGSQIRLGDVASVTSGPAQRTRSAQFDDNSVPFK